MSTFRHQMAAALADSRAEAADKPPPPKAPGSIPPPERASQPPGRSEAPSTSAGIVARANDDGSFDVYCREGLLACRPRHPCQWATLVYGSHEPADNAFVYARKLNRPAPGGYRRALAEALDAADDADIRLARKRQPRGPKPVPTECQRRMQILRENAWNSADVLGASEMAGWLRGRGLA
jgi:hypothetical protein